jgi:hypothetical protein
MPSFMQVPEIPVYVQNDVDRIQQSMMEISATTRSPAPRSRPGSPPPPRSRCLQEQDDTRLGPDVNDMEQAVGDAGSA